MITIDHNSCSQLDIRSDVVNYNEFNITIDKITVKATYNCCEPPIEKVLSGVQEGKITLLPSDFEMTDGLQDGVYTVTVKTEYSNQTIVTETACVLVDCDLKCHIVEKVAKDPFTDAHLTYYIIKEGAENCECSCEDMCELYRQLLTELGKSTDGLCTNTPCTKC